MVASETALSPSQFLSGTVAVSSLTSFPKQRTLWRGLVGLGNVSEICLVDGLARVDWQWFFSKDAAIALQIEKEK